MEEDSNQLSLSFILFLFLSLCAMSLQDVCDHSSPQLPFFKNPLSDTCSSINLSSRLPTAFLFSLPSMHPVSINFFKFSFLILCPQNYSRLFLIVNNSFLVVYFICKSFLPSCLVTKPYSLLNYGL